MLSYIIFAKWFGIISTLLALGMLFNLADAREMAKKMIDSEAGYIMGGVQPIIFGSLALVNDGSFNFGRPMVVSVIGLMMVLIGVYRVMFASHWKKLMTRYADKVAPLFSLFGLMFGLILLYIGYIAPLVR